MSSGGRPGPVDFGFQVARIQRRLRQVVDAELRVFGLTEATWRPLMYVWRLGEGVRQKELAAALGIEGPSLVRLLDGLERRGFIERRESDADRRARGIYLTPIGRDLQKRVARTSGNIQRRLLATVAPADLEVCERVFRTIEEALDEAEMAVRPWEKDIDAR
ncbi:MarR family winged helix-turn-helix transcriptional regulator [Reyranella sp. CPCC 100927]|uniref:MarR family winged helix-turn-helix transcriptional regulator n=1 Tax=Reyranella sp. CPCC 100927 TaxID=2599616 RepID=UPI0011B40ECE|nr:MarR family transcriptional regulator [Reyranella sp. CPCC 100927]TWT10873.1 MarR family transcriptional regulator [Reyranella sp. CPCC 100927]